MKAINDNYESINTEILLDKLNEAELKAYDSLSRYKFEMFSYWSSTWVKYNQLAFAMGIIEKKRSNPFECLVTISKHWLDIPTKQISFSINFFCKHCGTKFQYKRKKDYCSQRCKSRAAYERRIQKGEK